MWFTFNVLMAPYSAGMRQDLMDLQQMFAIGAKLSERQAP